MARQWFIAVVLVLLVASIAFLGLGGSGWGRGDQVMIMPSAVPSYLQRPMCSRPITTKLFKKRTKCVADFMFVNVWAQYRPKSSWTFVDVGANKGYSIIGLLQGIGIKKYNSSENFQNMKAFATRENLQFDSTLLCGACEDCKEGYEPFGSRHEVVDGKFPNVRVFAFDPIQMHAQYLQEAFQSFDTVTFSIRNLALSNTPGITTFGAEGRVFGKEALGIGTADKVADQNNNTEINANFYNVTVSTLDDELRGEKVDFIDVLLTDTEGNDYKVAEGAAEWIFAGKVGLYIFELGFDPLRSLGPHIRRLEKAGYRCYAPMGGGATQISHECWNPQWERIVGWMNVVCVNERLPHLLEAMRTITRFCA